MCGTFWKLWARLEVYLGRGPGCFGKKLLWERMPIHWVGFRNIWMSFCIRTSQTQALKSHRMFRSPVKGYGPPFTLGRSLGATAYPRDLFGGSPVHGIPFSLALGILGNPWDVYGAYPPHFPVTGYAIPFSQVIENLECPWGFMEGLW